MKNELRRKECGGNPAFSQEGGEWEAIWLRDLGPDKAPDSHFTAHPVNDT